MELDPFSHEFHEDPYPVYRWLRADEPCYLNEKQGWYALSRYADVLEASAGNPPTTFLVTVDSGPITYPGAADIATVEEAARQLGFTPRRTVPLGDGRDVRLWQREVPTGS